MEERHPNIFYNLVKNETSLTEVFCNLMMYKSFRNTFLEFVKNSNNSFDVDFQKVEFENFETEKDFGFTEIESEEDKKIGRGDLILGINDREYIFELKIEIFTSTTKNQPNGYFEYLEKRKKENSNQSKDDLFFILPKNYKHIENLSNVNEKNILYWEDFISLTKTKGLDDIPYIKDFIDILSYRWFYSEKFEFNEYEKNLISTKRKIKMDEKTIPQIMMNLTHKVDFISDKLKQMGYKLNSKDYKDENGYGIFIKNENKEDILWFGIDFKFWNEYEIPLSIGIDGSDNNYVELFKNKYGNEIKKIDYDTDEYFYNLPLSMETYDDTDKIIEKINEVKISINLV